MTHEVAPAVFVIHQVAAVREAIQGGNAAMNSIIGPIFVTPPAERRCPREERPRKKDIGPARGRGPQAFCDIWPCLPQPQHPIIVDEAVRRTQPGC
jgi:hypothetical protein